MKSCCNFYREFFYRQLWNMSATLSLCGLAAFSASLEAASLNLDNVPLYIGSNVQPIVMLDVTKDHQLHYKAYNDYTDLDGNGVLDSYETTYWHANDYYGYFDTIKCYSYDTVNNLFVPVGISPGNNKYCDTFASAWSGNFLNWVTMTRMDLVRKLLYGGKRSTDTSAATVLERDLLTNDGHASAKFYAGTDIAKLTPYNPPVTPPSGTATASNTLPSGVATGSSPLSGGKYPNTNPTVTVVPSGSVSFRNVGIAVCKNDPVKVNLGAATNNQYMIGIVIAVDTSGGGNGTCSVANQPQSGFTMNVITDLESLPIGSHSSSTNAAWTVTDQFYPNSAAAVTIGSGNFSFRNLSGFPAGSSVCRGDQLRVNLGGSGSANYMVGYVSAVGVSNPVIATTVRDCSTLGSTTGGFTLTVDPTGVVGAGSSGVAGAWTVTNNSSTGISFCNITNFSPSVPNNLSQTNTNPPLLRVAKGNFALWAAAERIECQWNPGNGVRGTFTFQSNIDGANGNYASISGSSLTAPTSNSGSSGPPNTFVPASVSWASAYDAIPQVRGLGYPVASPTIFDLTVRVQSCVSNALIGNEQCKLYGNGTSLKPIGLLQFYGDPGVDLMHFGLFTGSYAKNKSGGVLRKNAGTFTDEVDPNTGVFLRPAAGSIVDTLDKFKLYGYLYNGAATAVGDYSGDNCWTVTAGGGSGPNAGGTAGPALPWLNRGDFAEGQCTSWGNPMSEIYLESLRYLAHKSANPAFTYAGATQDSTLGLPLPAWNDPLTANTYCAPLNALVVNAATASFDDDQLSGVSDLNTAKTAQQLTDTVGALENINGNTWFVGNSDISSNNICSPKTVNNFSSAIGICPEQPRKHGSYLMAGIAYQAHTNKIRTDLTIPANDTNSLKVNSGGISLAPNVPKITIPVGSNIVTILPAARMEDQAINAGNPGWGAGQIVDFKVVSLTPTTGKYFVVWDVSEQGADYEMDLLGTISYTVNGATNQITVTTRLISQAASGCNGFGYVISGTDQDGAHFFSGSQDNPGICRNASLPGGGHTPFYYSYTTPSGTVVNECSGCMLGDPAKSHTFIATGNAGTLKDPLWYVAKYGSFRDLNGSGTPDQAAEWDSVINSTGGDGSDGIPDNYFPVTNPNRLQLSLDRAFVQILGISSSTSVATNSTSLNTGTRIFQARFNSADWSGQLLSFPVDLNGIISATQDWDSGQQINAQTPASRVIISYNPASGVAHNNSGIPFEWGNVSANATLAAYLNQNASGTPDVLGSSRLSYLRGDASMEGTSANTLRRRPASKLGDIINSNPQYVGAPDANYADPSYTTFASTYASRIPVVYMGANDGLFHGFNALQSTASGGGKEVLGYVPSRIYSDLPKLMSQNYVHRYYVDGTANVQDVCMATTSLPAGSNFCPAAANWKSVLVGGLRAGGQGVFALDVTDPSQFTEANANKLALWEFTDSDDSDLGFVYGQPQIGKMANGKWAVVFGNGYDNSYSCTVRPCPNMGGAEGPLDNHASASGHGVLYILFLQDGAANSTWAAGSSFIKLDTNVGTVGTPNGLAQPVLVDINGDGIVDYIYVGDLQGNMWKFDVTNSVPSNWASAFSSGPNPQPLFTATDASSNPQPITSAPVTYPNPQGGRVVLFGTGLYLQLSDPSNLSQQTIYGIWDNGSQVNGRSQLVAQTILANATTSAGTFRVTSQNTVNYAGSPTPTGWYMDFPNVSAGGNPVYGSGTATGERVVYNPIISSQKLVVNTAIPSATLCTAGGTTWTMDFDPLSGDRLTFSPFDTNGDNNFTSSDMVNIAGLGLVNVSGIASTVGISPTPTVISGATGSGKEYKILSGSTGGLASVLENNPGAPPPAGPMKRRAWREIFRQ